MKLVTGGELNRDVVNILRDNSRIGDAVWGDLEALMAAMRLLDERAVALCRRVGRDTFHQGVNNVITYAEQKARTAIRDLLDGTYTFTDYLESDNPDEAIHIHCRLTITGDEAVIDYSGSSPQVHAALNFGTGSRTHPFLCLALTNYIQTVDPSIPINGGILRPIRAFAPLGTLMNADFPAAMGNRWVAVMRTYDALMGCLNQAVRGGIAACGAGQAGIISAAWMDPHTGRSRVAVVEPFSGGSGGRVRADGVDATDTMIGYLKSTPIEHVEIETPLIVRCHELIPQTVGHGRYRGGASVCIELECRAPEATITVRGLDRFRLQPWGAYGGGAGCNGRTTLCQGSFTREIGKIKVLTLHEGDVLRMVSPSGGGFGSPLARDPHLVLRDVLDELISASEAATFYGVVIANDQLDWERTAALRGDVIERAEWEIAPGPERQRYENIWPIETSIALSEAAMRIPQGIRRNVLMATRRDLETAERPIGVAQAVQAVERHYERITSSHLPQNASERS
jgi:N-methylhydantoinase B